MSLRNLRILHVEDDPLQQRMIAHHLRALSEHVLDITVVASEEGAMECFPKGRFDLVLLDYQLAQGDGLHLLGRLRALDPIVPIISISGVATSEVAAQLVQAGADDYFDKRDLNSVDLAKSIRASLRRAVAVCKKMASRATDKSSVFTKRLTNLCDDYVRRMGGEFQEQLDVIAQDMKRAGISAPELEHMHENATARLPVAIDIDQRQLQLRARPLLFELIVRVYDDPA